ncbi:hypothetical protein BN938_0775 [Mucinivorans hirudinis]|uniref:Uncharacterized protein n=1 Tax=Mucinivorans hirudinis TaxID=1433126 RepID=A0A060RBZ0_9BACT|nr:hypothetical protein BN938_0775 [Mucinivorans hirudinis]
MIPMLKRAIGRNLVNIRGWHTSRKIVVIESDDWGAIRMPSLAARDRLLAKEVKFSDYGYEKYDTLASSQDLKALFEVLSKFKDKNSNHPIITANTIVANPDFEKIKAVNYQEYHYELFTDTLKRYYPNEDVFALWKQGMTERMFHPQFHGREHINFQMWLTALQESYKGVREAFEEGVFSATVSEDSRNKFLHSYNISQQREQEFVRVSIEEGLKIFKDIFGFNSLSAIAPSYTWDCFVEQAWAEGGVRYIQGGRAQCCSLLEGRRVVRHFTGQQNRDRQIYLVRNSVFEPSQYISVNNVGRCLKEIDNSFFWNKPAIISSHRLNFIGSLNETNRFNNLKMLEELFREILRKHPDVEFMSSDQLGNIITKHYE